MPTNRAVTLVGSSCSLPSSSSAVHVAAAEHPQSARRVDGSSLTGANPVNWSGSLGSGALTAQLVGRGRGASLCPSHATCSNPVQRWLLCSSWWGRRDHTEVGSSHTCPQTSWLTGAPCRPSASACSPLLALQLTPDTSPPDISPPDISVFPRRLLQCLRGWMGTGLGGGDRDGPTAWPPHPAGGTVLPNQPQGNECWKRPRRI